MARKNINILVIVLILIILATGLSFAVYQQFFKENIGEKVIPMTLERFDTEDRKGESFKLTYDVPFETKVEMKSDSIVLINGEEFSLELRSFFPPDVAVLTREKEKLVYADIDMPFVKNRIIRTKAHEIEYSNDFSYFTFDEEYFGGDDKCEYTNSTCADTQRIVYSEGIIIDDSKSENLKFFTRCSIEGSASNIEKCDAIMTSLRFKN